MRRPQIIGIFVVCVFIITGVRSAAAYTIDNSMTLTQNGWTTNQNNVRFFLNEASVIWTSNDTWIAWKAPDYLGNNPTILDCILDLQLSRINGSLYRIYWKDPIYPSILISFTLTYLSDGWYYNYTNQWIFVNDLDNIRFTIKIQSATNYFVLIDDVPMNLENRTLQLPQVNTHLIIQNEKIYENMVIKYFQLTTNGEMPAPIYDVRYTPVNIGAYTYIQINATNIGTKSGIYREDGTIRYIHEGIANYSFVAQKNVNHAENITIIIRNIDDTIFERRSLYITFNSIPTRFTDLESFLLETLMSFWWIPLIAVFGSVIYYYRIVRIRRSAAELKHPDPIIDVSRPTYITQQGLLPPHCRIEKNRRICE